jgi:hypothetical protein
MPGWCAALTSPVVPEAVKEGIRTLRARYDLGQHPASGNTSARQADELAWASSS